MTDVFKIAAIALVGGILSIFLRDTRREFAVLCAMVTGIIILFTAADMMGEIVTEFFALSEKAGIGDRYIRIILKTVGIAYICEFAAQLLKDAGEGAIASKVELAGRLGILYLTFPIIAEFLEVCVNAVNSI